MIIVAITGPSVQDALAQMKSSGRWADMFELRLDLIGNPDVRVLLRGSRKPAVVTLRPSWEGGFFTGSESERLSLLVDAIRAGAAYVDIECAAGKDFLLSARSARTSVKVILSEHMSGVAGPWKDSYRRLRSGGGDIIKWVIPAADVHDALPVFQFLRQAKKDRVRAMAMATGEAGEYSRILYRKFGGWGTYAAPETGAPAAPGQLRASMLKKVFRSDRLAPGTKVFGVLGNPLGQSRGIFVHNALYSAHRVNAVYVRFPVRNLERFFADVAPFVEGCSVTLPFKEEAGKYCASVDRSAARIGAVNTIYRRGKRLCATNTDAPAALDAIEKKVKMKGKTLLVVGAGGAARAVVHEALSRGAHVFVANRSLDRASRIAADSGASVVPIERLHGIRYDVLANTTSAGMVPDVDALPVPVSFLRPSTVVFDAIYNPPFTRLLREARKAGARTVSGMEMYLIQGAAQFSLFTGKKADRSLMRRTLIAALRH